MTNLFSIFSAPRPSRLTEGLRARLRPPDIEIADVRAALDRYGLELRGTPRNLAASRRNHNVTVATPAGKKLLKRYRPQWRAETVTYGHSIIARLAELRFPVPRLAVARDGRDFVELGSHHYALFEFVSGAGYSGSYLLRSDRRQLMAMSGATMARLHCALRGFTPSGLHHLGFQGYVGPRQRDAAWHMARLAELREQSRRLEQPADQPAAEWLLRRASAVAEQIGALDERLDAAPLVRTVIHGDYGLHNQLFGGDGTVTPVDFELARLEWRLSDLVSCLSRLRYGAGAYDFQSIGWFVAAYHAELPLSAEEWRLLPEVWRFYKLQGAVQYWSSYFETAGPARKLASARDAIEQAEWAASHAGQLLAQIGPQLRLSPARP